MNNLNPRFVCKDGFSISVQGNGYAYCTPRLDDATYTHVECGFPSSTPITKELIDYAENPDLLCETVYGYVPVYVVINELNAHGGLVGDVNTFKLSNNVKLIAE